MTFVNQMKIIIPVLPTVIVATIPVTKGKVLSLVLLIVSVEMAHAIRVNLLLLALPIAQAVEEAGVEAEVGMTSMISHNVVVVVLRYRQYVLCLWVFLLKQ
jgi:hypothetical protein